MIPAERPSFFNNLVNCFPDRRENCLGHTLNGSISSFFLGLFPFTILFKGFFEENARYLSSEVIRRTSYLFGLFIGTGSTSYVVSALKKAGSDKRYLGALDILFVVDMVIGLVLLVCTVGYRDFQVNRSVALTRPESEV